jgi:hypothetical protein
MIDTQIVSVSTHSILFEGLNVKTRYEILVTSIGDSSTSSEKATLKITATTADFKATSAKASNVTMTSVKLTITDNDKNIPFVAGKTVKTYTVQYVERTASKPDWSLAQSQTLTPGTPILDTKKGTVAVQLSGLIPGTQYFFRVQTSYTDGTSVLKTINVDGRQVTFKTAAFPTISISKTSFAVDKSSGYDLAVGLTGKVANINKIETGMTISFSLWVSTATTIDKATGKLTGAQALSIPVTFSSINSKGEFSMLPIELESIVNTLGAGKMLASKTLSFQLEAAFSGVTTTSCSKTGKITMPAWYSV